MCPRQALRVPVKPPWGAERHRIHRTHGARARVQARLTPQELRIVRPAARGLSNHRGPAFLSPRMVGYHLYKAYPKLGVASRGELGTAAL
jgi:DNA-binding NarL/FixJ family response regulator